MAIEILKINEKLVVTILYFNRNLSSIYFNSSITLF